MNIADVQNQLSQAIGKNKQNIKLVGDLTGWKLNLTSDTHEKESNVTDVKNIAVL